MATQFASIVNNGNYSGRLTYIGSYDLLSQDPIANTSSIRLYGSVYNGNSQASYGSDWGVFKLDGTTIYDDSYRFYYGTTSLGTKDIVVAHNADGSFPARSVDLYADSYHFNEQSTSGTIRGIPSIDRNGASVTLAASNITANGFTLTATTNQNCNKWEYRIGTSGSWTTFSTTDGKSASVALTGLNPAVSYTVYVRVTRTYNNVQSTSSVSATTLGYATIDSIANINTGSSAVVKFTPKATGFYYKVDFKLDGTTLATETIGNVAQTSQYSYTTAYKFPVTLLPNSTSATITATLYTYTNSSYNVLVGTGQTKTFTLTVPSSVVPSISTEVTPYNTNPWLNSKGIYVSGYTQIKIVASPIAGAGANISSVAVTGQSIDSQSDNTFYTSVLRGAGSKSVTTTVTDSRGRTASKSDSVTYLLYAAPAVNAMSAQRGTYSNGTWTSDENGNHIRVTASATGSLSSQGNTLTLTLTAKIDGIDTPPTAQIGNDYYWTDTTADQSYVVTAEVSDLVGNTSTSFITVSSVSVPFNLNTLMPAAAFGKVAEIAKALELAPDWRLMARGKYNMMDYYPYSFVAVGASGSDGYARIATINLVGTWHYSLYQFTVMRIYDAVPINLYVCFAGTSSSDPALARFVCDAPYGASANFEAFIYKRTTATWDIYVRKYNAADNITVYTHVSYQQQIRGTVTYADNLLTSVPSGATVATPYYLGLLTGTCTTPAGTAAKVATVNGGMYFPLLVGTTVCITFSNTNSAALANLTLNVNNTGAKSIKILRNGGINNLPDSALVANAPCLFTYNGTYWFLMSYDYNSNTTYSAMSQSEANTGTATTERSITATVLDTKIKNVISSLIKDYIIERGTSGNWTYEKWNSGKAVCWGRHRHSVTSWASWGNLYEANGTTISYPSGLFIANPSFTVTIESGGSGVLSLELWNSGTKDKTPNMAPVRPGDASTGGTTTVYFNIHAIGKWK